ncbi:hypothetical protein TL16_g08868 [Triparma laevis f. inornata]|uniref:Uncharacterized protein n=1 Tax=Triparma laevis f. inornata TaxID=1714386 RepID=A0A9W7EKJ5_9STRA|nr:hypothetical protein TL16_g08868 [Triparma laevis f. inornata]
MTGVSCDGQLGSYDCLCGGLGGGLGGGVCVIIGVGVIGVGVIGVGVIGVGVIGVGVIGVGFIGVGVIGVGICTYFFLAQNLDGICRNFIGNRCWVD